MSFPASQIPITAMEKSETPAEASTPSSHRRRVPEEKGLDSSDQAKVSNSEEEELVEEEEEEDEEGECGFCLFMKGGGCRESFIAWEKCVEDAEKNKENIVEKCSEVTGLLKMCMEQHTDYYSPILQAEKAAEQEAMKELDREKASAATTTTDQKNSYSDREQQGAVMDKKEWIFRSPLISFPFSAILLSAFSWQEQIIWVFSDEDRKISAAMEMSRSDNLCFIENKWMLISHVCIKN